MRPSACIFGVILRLPNFTGSKTKNSLELKPIIRGLRVITGIFLLQYLSFAYIFTKYLPYLHLYVIRANFCSPQEIEEGSSSSVQFHPRQPSPVRSVVPPIQGSICLTGLTQRPISCFYPILFVCSRSLTDLSFLSVSALTRRASTMLCFRHLD